MQRTTFHAVDRRRRNGTELRCDGIAKICVEQVTPLLQRDIQPGDRFPHGGDEMPDPAMPPLCCAGVQILPETRICGVLKCIADCREICEVARFSVRHRGESVSVRRIPEFLSPQNAFEGLRLEVRTDEVHENNNVVGMWWHFAALLA